MADAKAVTKGLTSEERKMLKDLKPKGRKNWIIKKHGSSTEKADYARFGRCPAWADSALNSINWEVK